MRTLSLSVDGMGCRRCVRQVSALIRDVEGVHVVQADATSGLITVLGTMTSADVLAALHETSFTVRLVRSHPSDEL